MHSIMEERGFGPFQPLYLDSWLHTNQKLTLQEDSSKEVIVKGLTKSGTYTNHPAEFPHSLGFLLALDESSGDFLELHPDSNSLNFWEGFISRKLQK